MSFWSWMRKTYPDSVIEWLKRRNLNFAMYFIGTMGSILTFGTSMYYFITGNPQFGLLYICLFGVGFVLGNYGVYREFES